jgi:polar amino acid transport system substrate-binding protein
MAGLRTLALAGWLALHVVDAVTAPATLRLCVSDQPFGPYTHPDGSGLFQQRVLAAAKWLDVAIAQYAAPRARCLQDSRQGRADALIGVFSPERLAWLTYPMHDGRPQAEQSVGRIQVVVFRRVGTRVEWDGQKLVGLGDQPLGLRLGFAYGDRLEGLGVKLDDHAMSNEQLIAKLVKGRVGAILLTDEALPQTARLPPGQIEALPRLYDTLTLYLIVTRDFEQRHTELVQKLWANLAAAGTH